MDRFNAMPTLPGYYVGFSLDLVCLEIAVNRALRQIKRMG